MAKSARPVTPAGLPRGHGDLQLVLHEGRRVARRRPPRRPGPCSRCWPTRTRPPVRPTRICSRSAEDAAKLNSTVVPGLAASKAAPTSSKASVSDAAAKTVIPPSSCDSAAVVVVVPDELSSSLPHAARSSRGARWRRAVASNGASWVLLAGLVAVNLTAALDRCPRPWQPQPVERRPTLSLNEWAVLGLLVERPRHGYDIAAELRPGTPIGEVWRLSRQLVYRALERLEALGLVEPRRTEHGTGPPRTVYGPTRRGRDALRRWLVTPVDHLRDVRSAFLLKLVLLERLGLERGDLVAAQRVAFADLFARRAAAPSHRQRRDPVAPPLSGRGGLVPRRAREAAPPHPLTRGPQSTTASSASMTERSRSSAWTTGAGVPCGRSR